MPGAKTMARYVIGVARQVTTSKNATYSAIADTAYDTVTMGSTVFALMTYATNSRTARSTLLTLTSSADTALPLMMTLMSTGC